MLRMIAEVSLDSIYLENTYYNLKLAWSDGDQWLPQRSNIVPSLEKDNYLIITCCEADFVNIFIDVCDSVSVDGITIIFADNMLEGLKERLKILTKQSDGSPTKVVSKMTNNLKEQERIKSFFRSGVNVTIN